jgi:hypothetical protein
MSTGGHILVVVLTTASVAFILGMVRHKQFPAKYALLWLSIAVVLVFLAAFPGVLDRASSWLGIAYPPATFLLGAVTLLFLIVVHFSFELSRLEGRTRRLAQELAVLRADPPDDRPRPRSPENQPVEP